MFRLKRMIRALGYDVNKIPSLPLQDGRRLNTYGKVVEFIGPSGVGKTTFYRKELVKYNDRWYTKSQVRKMGEYHNDLLCLKDQRLEKIYSELLSDKANTILTSNHPLRKKINLLKHVIGALSADVAARSSNLKKGLLSDDGFTHDFGNEIIHLEENIVTAKDDSSNQPDLRLLFEFRSIIIMTASPDYIIHNLKKRRDEYRAKGNEDAINNYYVVYQEKDLEEYVTKSIDAAEKMKAIAKKYGADVLLLDVEKENTAAIALRVDTFIHQILSCSFSGDLVSASDRC